MFKKGDEVICFYSNDTFINNLTIGKRYTI